MPRVVKQILYGLLYLGTSAAIVWFFVLLPTEEIAPTCIDNIQNQDEDGVDCGGPCADCELKDLRLKQGGVEIITVGEKSSLVVEVEDPSKKFGAVNIPYSFKIMGPLGEVLDTEEGQLNIFAGEKKYIAAVGIDVKRGDIADVVFTLGEFEFTPQKDLTEYDIDTEEVVTSFPEETIEVRGFVINDSAATLSKLMLTALLYTEEGDLGNVGATLISNLGAFEKRNFIISVPRNDFFIDPEGTEISWRVI